MRPPKSRLWDEVAPVTAPPRRAWAEFPLEQQDDGFPPMDGPPTRKVTPEELAYLRGLRDGRNNQPRGLTSTDLLEGKSDVFNAAREKFRGDAA